MLFLLVGNANYNYTDQSDIDVHLVIDEDNVFPGTKRDLVVDYFFSKMKTWLLSHNITVYGYTIEPSFNHLHADFHKGQGVYSLKNDKWIQKPVKRRHNFENNFIRKKTQLYMNIIDHIVDGDGSEDDVWKLKTKISNMRASAIEKGGEFSYENLVYKSLRNNGYMDKLNNYVTQKMDKRLSLENYSKI